MSDFTSDFWSVYVAAITLASILACLALLWFSGKARAMTSSDNSTGHVWDGDLREMNNPLPRWWAWLFVITIIFSLIYLALYPGLGSYAGKFGWTSTSQFKAEVDQGNAQIAPLYARFTAMKPEDVAKDAKAMAIGERLFQNNCAQCHGSDARGARGIPNLTDKFWLGGDTPEFIKATIIKGRSGIMPALGAAVGSAEDVKNVAQYVLSLSGGAHDSVRAALGKDKFALCAACHGPDGKGMHATGSSDLSNPAVWMHGSGEAHVIAMVNNGKTNVMPAQGDKFTDAQLHVLTAYVWGLSNK